MHENRAPTDSSYEKNIRRAINKQIKILNSEIVTTGTRLKLDLTDRGARAELLSLLDSEEEFDFAAKMDGVQDAKYFLAMAAKFLHFLRKDYDDSERIDTLCSAFKLVGLVSALIGDDRTKNTCPTCIGMEYVSFLAREKANVAHDKPNGSRAKRKAIQELWDSGRYTSRDICAEQECAALDMSFSTARKALRGRPDPT